MANWIEVKKEDVLKAIVLFDSENPTVPPAKNTFLKYNGKQYPAKHIRGMAYKEALGLEISKSEYAGGMETVRFFQRLGFEIIYKGYNQTDREKTKQEEKMAELHEGDSIKDLKIKISSKGVVEQKNALQLVLNKYFNGEVVSEKTFNWLVTPGNKINYNKELYGNLITRLKDYRSNTNFAKENYRLKCDFVCQSKKVIFEYDERQHFTHARKIALDVYKNVIDLHYNVDHWTCACNDISAKDNWPLNRDEARAFYDSVRDIEAFNNGYRLIRIMHGEFDWESADAVEYLNNILDIDYCGEKENQFCIEKIRDDDIQIDERILKVGLFLQDRSKCLKRNFDKIMQKVQKENLDLLVFPEDCYTYFSHSFVNVSIHEIDGYIKVKDACMELSKNIGCAIIYGGNDFNGIVYSLYANAFASAQETEDCIYYKHTATMLSAFDLNYNQLMKENFPIITLKSVKIGMTICYDCNHSLFSRVYGLKGVDIINSTGGNVVHMKWYRYNKTRSLENNCFSLCTMGYSSYENNKSYTFAFNSGGAPVEHVKIIGHGREINKPGNIYIYNIILAQKATQEDISFNQKENSCKKVDFEIYPHKLNSVLEKAKKIEKDLYVLQSNDKNIVICLVDSNDIFKPEAVCRLLYNKGLGSYKKKKYLLINRWKVLNTNFYANTLSDVLKTRASENFIGVILISPEFTKCYQSGFNKNVQVVPIQNNIFGIDTSRMGGPEVIWKESKVWRAGYEMLMQYIIGNFHSL